MTNLNIPHGVNFNTIPPFLNKELPNSKKNQVIAIVGNILLCQKIHDLCEYSQNDIYVVSVVAIIWDCCKVNGHYTQQKCFKLTFVLENGCKLSNKSLEKSKGVGRDCYIWSELKWLQEKANLFKYWPIDKLQNNNKDVLTAEQRLDIEIMLMKEA